MTVLKESEALPGLQNTGPRRLRIAWISEFGRGGGVPGMAIQLVAALSAQDCELVVFSRTPSKDVENLFSREVLAKNPFFSVVLSMGMGEVVFA